MAVLNLYSDISSYINVINEGSFETLMQRNLLVPTATFFGDQSGMNARKVYRWGTVTMRSLADGEDMTSENFNKTLANTLTPARYGDELFMSRMRVQSDWENFRDEAVMALGDAAARHIDQNIGTAIAAMTGGTVTVGSGLGTANWSHIFQAYSLAQQLNIPGPYFCALGAGQWYHLLNNGGTANLSTFMRSDAFQDRIANNYLQGGILPDVTFVITNGLVNHAGGTCKAGLYNRGALAYDERGALEIVPTVVPSRDGWTLDANFYYASGTYDPLKGIQIVSTDVIG